MKDKKELVERIDFDNFSKLNFPESICNIPAISIDIYQYLSGNKLADILDIFVEKMLPRGLQFDQWEK